MLPALALDPELAGALPSLTTQSQFGEHNSNKTGAATSRQTGDVYIRLPRLAIRAFVVAGKVVGGGEGRSFVQSVRVQITLKFGGLSWDLYRHRHHMYTTPITTAQATRRADGMRTKPGMTPAESPLSSFDTHAPPHTRWCYTSFWAANRNLSQPDTTTRQSHHQKRAQPMQLVWPVRTVRRFIGFPFGDGREVVRIRPIKHANRRVAFPGQIQQLLVWCVWECSELSPTQQAQGGVGRAGQGRAGAGHAPADRGRQRVGTRRRRYRR